MMMIADSLKKERAESNDKLFARNEARGGAFATDIRFC